MLEGGGFVAGGFIGGGEFIVESGAGFFVNPGGGESLVIPADCRLRHALVEEALGKPGIGLHNLREGMAAIDGLAGLLQLADSFIEQSHFAEGDAEVVVGFGIFFGGGSADFEIVFELAEHFREVDACVFAEGGRLGGGSAGEDGRDLRLGRGRCGHRLLGHRS